MLKRVLLPLIAFAFLATLQTFPALAQQVPSAVIADPPPDKTYPASMAAPNIPSHGSRLNAIIYLAAGPGPHPTVLLMHGFPGNEQNMDLAYSMRRAGWNVAIPHYRGSWGSAGTFSFANAIEDTQAVVQFLRDPENVKKYRSDPKRLVLAGHSMGGFMVAYTAAHDPSIEAVALIAAWNIGPVVSRPNAKASSMRGPSIRLAGSTPEGLFAEAKRHAADWNYVHYAPALKNRPILIVEADDNNLGDNKAMAEALRNDGDTQVTEIHMHTDHPFSDHRIALQAAVVNWLDALKPDPSAAAPAP